MNSSYDPCDAEILGLGFKDVAVLNGQGLIIIKEDNESFLSETNEPKFELTIHTLAAVGERVRMVLTNHPHRINMVAKPPDKDGWQRWHVMLKFKVEGDDETEEGKKLRKESILKVWKPLLKLLTTAINGVETKVRPNVRPVTNITNLIN